MGLFKDAVERITDWRMIQKSEYDEKNQQYAAAMQQNMRPVSVNTAGVRYYIPRPVEVLWMTKLAFSSDILRNVIDKIGYKIFRNGTEWKPKFVVRCDTCDLDVQYEAKECPECKGSVRKPDEKQKKPIDALIESANENGQTLIEVLEQCNDDVEILDNQWIVFVRDYAIDTETGLIIYDSIREIVRGDPANFKFLADAQGRLGRDPAGKPVRICIMHRTEAVTDARQVFCKRCKGKSVLHPAHFVQEVEGGSWYYTKDEVIHNSKYNPGLLYGFPPVYSIAGKVELLLNMDEYMREAYGSKRSPKGIAVARTKNQNAFVKAWEYIVRKGKEDPHNIYPLTIESPDGAQKAIEVIDLMKPLTELQAVEFMDNNRLQIASFYGVSPIFVNNTQASGGLNNEGLQFGVTNEAAERGQALYNSKFFPRLLKAAKVTDWCLQLKAAEEQDVLSDIQRDGAKMDNAAKMKAMGFTVTRKPDAGLEFQYSEEPAAPMPGAAPGGAPGIPGLQEGAPKPPESDTGDQQYHGLPEESAKAKSIAARALELMKAKEKAAPPVHGIEKKSDELNELLDEPLDVFIQKLDWKRRPNEAVLKATVDKLTKKLGYDLHRKSKAQIKKLYLDAMEKVEKEMNMNLSFSNVDQNAVNVITGQKVFTKAYEGMSKSLSSKINEVISKAYENPKEFTVEKMVERMKMAADEEEYRLANIARTETQHVSAVARLNSYQQTQDFDQAKFEWFGPEDHRTTPICQAIKARVGNGVNAQQLKAIVEEESRNGNPSGWEVRDWTPHVNCRHIPLRIDVLGKAKAESFYPELLINETTPKAKADLYGYGMKLKAHGDDPKSVGWTDRNGQEFRFNQIAGHLPKGADVLDVGAGLGHFQEHLKAKGMEVHYKGIEILDDFVAKAKALGRDVEKADCMQYGGLHDYVVASGTFNTKDAPSLIDAIPKMAAIARKGVAFNYLAQTVHPESLQTYPTKLIQETCNASGLAIVSFAEGYQPGEFTVFASKAKAITYLAPGEKPPEGASVQQGERGGKFYDTTNQTSGDSKPGASPEKQPGEESPTKDEKPSDGKPTGQPSGGDSSEDEKKKPGNSEGPAKAPTTSPGLSKEIPKVNPEERINSVQKHFTKPETKQWASGVLDWHNKTPANVPLFVYGTHTNENPKTEPMRKTLLQHGYSVIQIPEEFSRYQGLKQEVGNREKLNAFLGELLQERMVVDIHAGEGGPQEIEMFDAPSLEKMDGMKAPKNYIGLEVMGEDSGTRALESTIFGIQQIAKKQAGSK